MNDRDPYGHAEKWNSHSGPLSDCPGELVGLWWDTPDRDVPDAHELQGLEDWVFTREEKKPALPDTEGIPW